MYTFLSLSSLSNIFLSHTSLFPNSLRILLEFFLVSQRHQFSWCREASTFRCQMPSDDKMSPACISNLRLSFKKSFTRDPVSSYSFSASVSILILFLLEIFLHMIFILTLVIWCCFTVSLRLVTCLSVCLSSVSATCNICVIGATAFLTISLVEFDKSLRCKYLIHPK